MMKYFAIQTHRNILKSIQIDGWREKIRPDWLCMDELYRIPKRLVFPITMGEFTPFPDMITAPFLLVSELVYGVIKMYGDMVYTRDVILVDSKSNMEKRYYLLVLDQRSNKIVPQSERNLFQAELDHKQKLVVSLDLAESILRRGAVGIALDEINPV